MSLLSLIVQPVFCSYSFTNFLSYCSPSNCLSSHVFTEGNQVDQVWFVHGKSCWIFTILYFILFYLYFTYMEWILTVHYLYRDQGDPDKHVMSQVLLLALLLKVGFWAFFQYSFASPCHGDFSWMIVALQSHGPALSAHLGKSHTDLWNMKYVYTRVRKQNNLYWIDHLGIQGCLIVNSWYLCNSET